MATSGDADGASNSTSTSTNFRCLMHVESVKFEKTKGLTNVRWRKFTSCAKEWLDLSGRDREIAEETEREGLLVLHYDEACNTRPDLGEAHIIIQPQFVFLFEVFLWQMSGKIF